MTTKTTTTFVDPAKLVTAQAKLTKLNARVARLRNRIRNLQAAQKRASGVTSTHTPAVARGWRFEADGTAVRSVEKTVEVNGPPQQVA